MNNDYLYLLYVCVYMYTYVIIILTKAYGNWKIKAVGVSSSRYVWTQIFRKAVMLNDFDIDMVMGVQKRQGHNIYNTYYLRNPQYKTALHSYNL